MYPSLAQEERLGEPQGGTFEQGDGQPTNALANPNVSLDSARMPSGSPWMQSPGVWVAVMLVLVGFALIHRHHTDEFKRVRIGLDSWFTVGLLSASFIYVFKVGSAAYAKTPVAIKQFFGAL